MGGARRGGLGAAGAGALALFLLSGCGSAGGGGTYREPGTVAVVTGDGTFFIAVGAEATGTQRVALTPAEAWSVLPRVYEAIEVDTDILAPVQRQIGATQHRFSGQILKRSPSDFFDCGMDPGLNAPLADRAPIQARIVTDVLAAGEGAELRTNVTATARRPGGAAGIATCRSLGLLEILIGKMVEDLSGK